jgi:hypothetical protein
MVMKSAEDWRFDISSPLNRTRDRRIFVLIGYSVGF